VYFLAVTPALALRDTPQALDVLPDFLFARLVLPPAHLLHCVWTC
jgi:hypothetical protein